MNLRRGQRRCIAVAGLVVCGVGLSTAALGCSWRQPTRPSATEGVEIALLQLDSVGAARSLRSLRSSSAPLAAFYENHGSFLRALATQDPARLSRYYRHSERYLDALVGEDYTSRLYRAEVYFERAVLKGIEQRNLSAYFDLRRSHNLVQELEHDFPKAADHQKLLGTFEAVVGAVPASYQWLVRLMGFHGNLHRGLTRLHRAASGATTLRAEAAVAVALAERHLLNRPERAQARLDSVSAWVGGSPIFIYIRASSAMDNKHLARATEILAERRSAEALDLPFNMYIEGRIALAEGRYIAARSHFQHFLRQSNPTLLRRAAHLRMAYCFALEGQAEQAHTEMQRVTECKASLADEDAYALRHAREYLTRPFGAADLALLRARLSFDGGLLEASLTALSGLDLRRLSAAQQVEWHYRSARVLHEQHHTAAATAEYAKALPIDAPTRLWMQVYSYYYLGQLAEEAGQRRQARWYYNQALSFSGYDYQSGLEAKAKAGLNRLGPLGE